MDIPSRHWPGHHETAENRGAITVRWSGKLRHVAIRRPPKKTRVVP